MHTTNSLTNRRPFSLVLYLLIVFGLSWPFQIVSVIWAPSFFWIYLLNSIAMLMVTVGTFIAGKYVFRDGFANAGWQWGRLKHYLGVIALIVALWIFPTLVRLAIGSIGPGDFDRTQAIWLLVLPIVTLIPGFGEEFGWRGYMLPRLAERLSARKAVALHAVIWWAWHLPVLVGTGIAAGIAGAAQAGLPVSLSVTISVIAVLLVGALPSIMHGVVFAYIWFRSRSLAVATFYHAAYDGVRDSLNLFVGLAPMVSLWANLLLTILGIIFLWKGNWKNLEKGAEADQE